MSDITIRLPFGNPLDPPLITLADQGDGTYAPKVSAGAITAASSIVVTAISGGSSGQIVQSDGTHGTWAAKSVTAAQVAGGALGAILQSNGTVGGFLSIYAEAASVPVAYLTPLFGDTTAVTGGLYAWNSAGAAYRKVSGILP